MLSILFMRFKLGVRGSTLKRKNFQFSLWDSHLTHTSRQEYFSDFQFSLWDSNRVTPIATALHQTFNSLYEIRWNNERQTCLLHNLSILFMRFLLSSLSISSLTTSFQFSLWDSAAGISTANLCNGDFQFSLWDSEVERDVV